MLNRKERIAVIKVDIRLLQSYGVFEFYMDCRYTTAC